MTPSDICRVGFLWTPILETFDFGSKHPIKIGLSGYAYEAPKQVPPYEDDEETWEEVRKNVERVKELVFPIHDISV